MTHPVLLGVCCVLLLLPSCQLERERARRALESPDSTARAEALDKLAESGDLESAGPLIVPLLRDPSARVRKHAVAALGVLGLGPHLRHVIDRLNDADLEVRLTAVRVLGDSGRRAARPALLLTLQDQSMVIRKAAGLALEALGMSRPEQVRALAREELDEQIARLRRPDEQLKATSARMIGESERPEGLPPLVPLLTHPSPLVSRAAARAVGRIGGPTALKRLTRMSGARAPSIRRAAALGLAELAAARSGEQAGARTALHRLLRDPERAVKGAALDALARSGGVDGKHVKEVCRLLLLASRPRDPGPGKGPSPSTPASRPATRPTTQPSSVPVVTGPQLARKAAVLLGGRGAGECADEVKLLCKRAGSGELEVLDVLDVLEPLGGAEVDAALLGAARRVYETYRHEAEKWVAPHRWKELDEGDGKPQSRSTQGSARDRQVASLLSRFPEQAPSSSVDPLIPPSVPVRRVARLIGALAGRSDTDRWLSQVAKEAPVTVRAAALMALVGSRGPGPAPASAPAPVEVRRALTAALGSKAPALRRAALEACPRLGEEARKRAIELLEDDDFDVRSAAARCLGRLRSPGAVKPLLAALKREHSLAAIEALALLGDHAATGPILALLREDHAVSRRGERVAVIDALGRLGDRAAVTALENEVTHNDWRVRLAAARALGRVSRPASERVLALCENDYYAEVRRACRAARRDLERDTRDKE
jgi:HEAT repeat protein